MDSWFIKRPKSGEYVNDISASSCTEESHGSRAVKKKVRRYQADFLTFILLIN
jgi:hypothetical protein